MACGIKAGNVAKSLLKSIAYSNLEDYMSTNRFYLDLGMLHSPKIATFHKVLQRINEF